MAEEMECDAVLRAADDTQGPRFPEFPRGFDRGWALTRVHALVERLQTDFGCRCVVDTGVEDASFHADIAVPREATEAGERITIRLSNFGDFAVLAAENPGCYLDLDDAEAEGALTPDDRRRTETAVVSLGYVLIPEPALHRPYPYAETTWWIRFFDYL